LIALGIAIFVAGVRNFSRAGTSVRSTRPVRTLVTTGIHSWSRNPIYVGMFLVYGGIGIAALARISHRLQFPAGLCADQVSGTQWQSV
jgi:protein-S-isoprenylcysteine O-methyltransferase Ste14